MSMVCSVMVGLWNIVMILLFSCLMMCLLVFRRGDLIVWVICCSSVRVVLLLVCNDYVEKLIRLVNINVIFGFVGWWEMVLVNVCYICSIFRLILCEVVL